jgi:TPR repeat protein
MRRSVWMVFLLLAGNALAQPNPMLRIDPASIALYRQAEALDRAGNDAGVLGVWRARVDAGDDLAQFESGVVLLRSASAADVTRGIDLIHKSAASGYVRAQLRLYFMYRNGLAPQVQADESQAIAWLRRSAEQGFATAQVHLGLAYESGFGVARDPRQALALIQRAAGQNHPCGHFGLGAAHEAGIGTPPDPERARAAYRTAIERTEQLLAGPTIYVYRPIFEKWIVDARAAIAGLESTAARLEGEQAKVAEERRKVEAENVRLAAERRRIADEEARRAAEERKEAEEARLAAERRRVEAERAQLAEERRRLEAENARLAEEERRKSEERKRAEDARLAEERRKLEEEQARIAEERRRIDAEAVRVGEERRREEQARVAAAKPAAKPAAAPKPTPAAQRQGGENDLAVTFGRLVRGLTMGVQIASGVRDAAKGVRARDVEGVSKAIDTITAAATGERTGSAAPGGAGSRFGNVRVRQIPNDVPLPEKTACLNLEWITAPLPATSIAPGVSMQPAHQRDFSPPQRRNRFLALRNDCGMAVNIFASTCLERRTLRPGRSGNASWGEGELTGLATYGLASGAAWVGSGQYYPFAEEFEIDGSTTAFRLRAVDLAYIAWEAAPLDGNRHKEPAQLITRKIQKIGIAYHGMMHGPNATGGSAIGISMNNPVEFRKQAPRAGTCADVDPVEVWRNAS